jgi:hypothetical protein
MNDDDILQEIRATREAFAAAHNYDVRAMAETLKKMDLRGRTVVNFEAAPNEKIENVSEESIPTRRVGSAPSAA